MALFQQRWLAQYTDIGLGKPIYTHKKLRASSWLKATQKAGKSPFRPPNTRLMHVKRIEPRLKLKLPRFRVLTAIGWVLLGVGLLSPHWVDRTEHRVMHYERVEIPQETRPTVTLAAP